MKNLKFKLAVAAGAVSLSIILFLLSPFFSVQEIIISGYDFVGRMEINSRLDIGSTDNLLTINTRAARRRLMENLYIGSVTFRRDFPGRLYVDVQERRLTAYVEHMPGSFLFIDEFGRVLEVRTYITINRPIVTGLNFVKFALGEILEVPDSAAFGVVVHYAQLLNRYGITYRVSHIDVSDINNTRIRIGHLEFNVGNINNGDEKIRTIVEILRQLPDAESMRGFVDLREIRRDYIFEILT